MDDAFEVRAYRDADFRQVNQACARRALGAAGRRKGVALDLGTGPGEIPVLFCRMAPGWRVTALDASPRMLAAARKNVERSGLAGRIALVKGDAKTVKGFGRRFDLIFSNSLVHHLDDPVPFWRRLGQLLKPGGAVMVQDLSRPSSRRKARSLVALHAQGASPLLRELFYRSLLAAYTPQEIRLQQKQARLENLQVRGVSDRHWVVRGQPSFKGPVFKGRGPHDDGSR